MTAQRKTAHWLSAAIVLVVLGLLAGCGVVLALRFPFRRDTLLRQLSVPARTKVEIGNFTESWLSPGFAAERVRVSDPNGNVITVDRIVVRGSYAGLLSHPVRLKEIDFSGLRVRISPHPPGAPEPFGTSTRNGFKPKFRVDEIHLSDALLQLPRDNPGSTPLDFFFHTAILRNLDLNSRMKFTLAAHNPIPPGEVHMDGEAGPLRSSTLRDIPIEGQFTFENANLTVPRSITGVLNAAGKCEGTIGHLECAGTGDVPQFQVFGSAHTVHIESRYRAIVDAVTGDAQLEEVLAHFNRTNLAATGSVSGQPDPRGKTLTLDLSVRGGRLEDLLTLFTSAPQPGMRAAMDMHARFVIPPGPPGFLSKLEVDGKFFLQEAYFTNPNSQTPLNRLSASAEGVSKADERQDPQLATGKAQAIVTGRDGVARLNEVIFSFPGIQGQLEGTFGLRDKQLHLDGDFETQGKLSDTTSGLKAVLLKAIGPFFPKTSSVKTVPFTITGPGSHAAFHLRLHQK